MANAVNGNFKNLIGAQFYNTLFTGITGDNKNNFDNFFGNAFSNLGRGGRDAVGNLNLFADENGKALSNGKSGSVLIGGEKKDVLHAAQNYNSFMYGGAGNDRFHVTLQDKSYNNFIWDFATAGTADNTDTIYVVGIENFDEMKIQIFYKPANNETGVAYFDVWYVNPNDKRQTGPLAKIFTTDTGLTHAKLAELKGRIKEGNAFEKLSIYSAAATNPGNAWAGARTQYEDVTAENFKNIVVQGNKETTVGGVTTTTLQAKSLEKILRALGSIGEIGLVEDGLFSSEFSILPLSDYEARLESSALSAEEISAFKALIGPYANTSISLNTKSAQESSKLRAAIIAFDESNTN